MPFTYDFRCSWLSCQFTFESTDHVATKTCPICGQISKRIYTPFAMKRIQIEPVFNPSLGKFVTSESDMKSKFRQASDSASERLGYDVNYTPVDMSETSSLHVTSEGLSSDKLRTYEKHTQ